ncbi:MAG: hypothetical protein IKF14_11980 [Atopobiaceae bacterium]|nr:hypothetical protein [Atopobiaceae bacterium]
MIEAGISPILWRELAKMNTDEEAAGTYFQSSDAFRNIVRLVSEAQAPINGERAKPLWDVAATIASQVATQAEDRARETECKSAGDAVLALSDAVERYADAREALKLAEDQAHRGYQALAELENEATAHIEELQEKIDSYRGLRAENEQRKVSSEIRVRQAELQRLRQTAEELREDLERKRHAYQEAAKRVTLDEAARSYQRYKQFDSRYKAKRNELEVLKGNMEASEELARASKKAWRSLRAAEKGVRHALFNAQQNLEAAALNTSQAKEAHDKANKLWGQRSAELGNAQGTLENASSQLEKLASKTEGMQSAQKTIDGFYSPQAIEALEREATRKARRAEETLKHAREQRETGRRDFETARSALESAQVDLAKKQADAKTWEGNLARANELDTRVRDALSLWEEPVELVAVGRIAEAREHAKALQRDAAHEERSARERAAMLQRRLDALGSGRLDMSDQLRRWLDQHAIEAKTLASFEGITPAERSSLFEARPWLAHVLVADDRTSATLSQLAGEDELSELGHPVFYMRQADVYEFMNDDAEDPANEAKELVHALHTIEQAYLDDPIAYERGVQNELADASARAEEQQQIIQKLDAACDAVVELASFFESISMGEGATVANVRMREESSRKAHEEAEAHVRQCEEKLAALREQLDQLEHAVANAEIAERRARETHDDLVLAREQNETCIRTKELFDKAERAYRETERQKEHAFTEWENARSTENQAQIEFDRTQREKDVVDTLRSTLEGLSAADVEEAVHKTDGRSEEQACTPGELETSINTLKDIIARHDRNLEIAQTELDSLRRQRDGEERWQQILRDDRADGVSIVMKDIKAWMPRDDVDRHRLSKEKSRTRNERDAARHAYQEADNRRSLSEERLNELFLQLEQLGLHVPLEIPDGYDYQATRAAIDADEERDSGDLRRARHEKEHMVVLQSQLDRIAIRLALDDRYRAKESASALDLVSLDAWDAYVTELKRVEESCCDAIKEAKSSLERSKSKAIEAVRRTKEISAARGTKESAESVMSTCTSYESMMRVKSGLEDQSMQFNTMAATLQNKLRATNESVDDLVERAVKEGYQLLEELHQLVMISRVNITGKNLQRTIDFRSRGKTQFYTAIQRDEVATSRLERYVRKLLMEELPSQEDATRAERAKVWLEPHELVYVMLDDRSVEVRYPVIRGGKGLSYESARDVTGSGSTGQKSAGYVLAFLALLRYLGSVGSLSSENSLFVALENQFGKISSSKIILDIKSVADQTHMQLITVAGRELRSAYAIGDVTFTLYRLPSKNKSMRGMPDAVRVQVDESDQYSADAIIDAFRATRQFENLQFDF